MVTLCPVPDSTICNPEALFWLTGPLFPQRSFWKGIALHIIFGTLTGREGLAEVLDP